MDRENPGRTWDAFIFIPKIITEFLSHLARIFVAVPAFRQLVLAVCQKRVDKCRHYWPYFMLWRGSYDVGRDP